MPRAPRAAAPGLAEPVDLDDTVTLETEFHHLAGFATAGNPAATAILTDAARPLARAIVVVVNLLDIDRAIFDVLL